MQRNAALQEYLYVKQVVSLDEICREFAPRYPKLTELFRQLLDLVTFEWEDGKVMCYLLRTAYGSVTRSELKQLRRTGTPTVRKVRKLCKNLGVPKSSNQKESTDGDVSEGGISWAEAEKIITSCFVGGREL